ncbi:MAG: glycosyltransferase [Rikenellaceae bacterium]
MDISVLIPIYKVEKYIERCLRSLFEQTKTDGVEFILVNDCTPDGSMEIARRVVADYPNLVVKIINHEVNRGLPLARQTGLESATGEYILHTDSDDWCEPTMLEELYTMAKESGADIICCDAYKDDNHHSQYVKYDVPSTQGVECAELLMRNKIRGYLWIKFIKRSLYIDNKIRFIEGINLGEDVLVATKLFTVAKKVLYVPKAYYHYMVNSATSISNNINLSTWREMYELLPIELGSFFKERGIVENSLLIALRDMKLYSKLALISCAKGDDRKRYAKIHPEVDQFIPTMSRITPLVRFGLIQATKGRVYIFDIVAALSKLKKFIKRK